MTVSHAATDHSDVYDILRSRHEVLKEVRAEWSISEPKVTYMYIHVHVHCRLLHVYSFVL